jgi:hypothetical protein
MTEKRACRATVIAYLLLLALTAILAFGCKATESLSASDCMKDFAAALNAGNFDLGGYAHTGAVQYQKTQVKLFWQSNFEGDGSFLYTMNGNTATATEAGASFVFTLEEDDGDYAIRTITKNGTTIFD